MLQIVVGEPVAVGQHSLLVARLDLEHVEVTHKARSVVEATDRCRHPRDRSLDLEALIGERHPVDVTDDEDRIVGEEFENRGADAALPSEQGVAVLVFPIDAQLQRLLRRQPKYVVPISGRDPEVSVRQATRELLDRARSLSKDAATLEQR